MKVAALCLGTILLNGCLSSATAQQAQASWCNVSRVADDGEPIQVQALEPVVPEHWDHALALLNNRRLVPVSDGEASRLSGLGHASTGANSYLVRGSVFLAGQSSREAAYQAARERRRFVLSVNADNALIVLSVETSSEPLTAINVPMVVRVSRPLNDSHLGCWAMS